MKFKRNETVIIKKFRNNPNEKFGRIDSIEDGKFRVTNMNMPFMGTVSDTFSEDEIEKIEKK